MNRSPHPLRSPRTQVRPGLATVPLLAALSALLSALLLAGCGNKGPLVLSEAAPEATAPAEAAADDASELPPAPKTEPPAAHD